jgi:hypothetical protein
MARPHGSGDPLEETRSGQPSTLDPEELPWKLARECESGWDEIPRRPHGLVGLREAEFRAAHPGQHSRRGARSSKFEHAVKIWERVLTSPEVQQYDVSPWDALLLSVRVAAGRVAWTDVKLQEAIQRAGDNVLRDQDVRRWQLESRSERKLLGALARDAVTAGVQDRLVRQIELEGQLLADVLTSTLLAIPDLDARWAKYLLDKAQARLLTIGVQGERQALPVPDYPPGEEPVPPDVPVLLPRPPGS